MSETVQFFLDAWSSIHEGLWIPEGPGKWCRPLRFLSCGRGWVELMRLTPGAALGWHRHSGEVHAINLQGSRKLCTGEIVGPGGYVHESAGNVDAWEAVGEQDLVLFVVVMGTVQYLGDGKTAHPPITTEDRIRAYEHYCAETGIQALSLIDS